MYIEIDASEVIRYNIEDIMVADDMFNSWHPLKSMIHGDHIHIMVNKKAEQAEERTEEDSAEDEGEMGVTDPEPEEPEEEESAADDATVSDRPVSEFGIKVYQMLDEGISVHEIADKLKCTTQNVYYYKRKRDKENGV